MKIIGIDYGRKKMGLAISEGILAEPYKVIRYENVDEAIEKIRKETEKIDKVVVGISEEEMGEESKEFSNRLRENLSIPVETFDETLTTQEAQRLGIEAGIKRKKRKEMEDAYAAAVVLQSYLDKNV